MVVPALAAGTALMVNVVTACAVGLALGVTETEGSGRAATVIATVPCVPAPRSPLAEPVAPIVAVTVAGWLVVSVTCATPFASVLAVGGAMAPAVVEKVSGMVGSGLPLASTTVAVMALEPPL